MYLCMIQLISSFYYIVIVYIVAGYYVILQWLQTHNKATNVRKKENLVALVTGGGRGIGLETCKQLVKLDITIIIAGIYEYQEDGLLALKEINKEKVLFIECDLSSIKSVEKFSEEFAKLKLPLHILINNAGIMFSPYFKTEDDLEGHWAINYLSHFYLTHLMLKHLIASASFSCPSRIVNLASCLHYPATINFSDINGKSFYSAEAAYCQSKLAMVLFAKKLSREIQSNDLPILINSVHPGVAFSSLYKYVWWAKLFPKLGHTLLKTPAQASDTIVHVAVSQDITCNGNYFENCQVVQPSREAQSMEIQDKLWNYSLSELNIKHFGDKCDF